MTPPHQPPEFGPQAVGAIRIAMARAAMGRGCVCPIRPLGLSIDPAARAPTREMADLLENAPAARLFDEMLKLLTPGHAVPGEPGDADRTIDDTQHCSHQRHRSATLPRYRQARSTVDAHGSGAKPLLADVGFPILRFPRNTTPTISQFFGIVILAQACVQPHHRVGH